MSSDLIERKLRADLDAATEQHMPVMVVQTAYLSDLVARMLRLQAELAEARGKALEEAAQEADKWFPADTASRYPTGGIAAAIRALKATAIEARDWSK